MPRKPPRYDLPHAAPEPLRLVQRFVNSCDLSHDSDWLAEWLAEHDLAPSARQLDAARELREAIRELLYVNNGQPGSRAPWAALEAAADAARLTIDFASPPRLVSRAGALERLLGDVVIAAYGAIGDGTWPRLKCCRNHECRWAFYDYSKNRSASWCSMQICGNRTKTRSYRERRR